MTSGSSQGLFVIVAVVIFGIFILISYLLFRDKLQTGLASIFNDSILETNTNIGLLKNLDGVNSYLSTITTNDGLYTINVGSNFPSESSRSGLRSDGSLEVPFGYKLTISFDIKTPVDSIINIDFNASPKDSSKSWNVISEGNYGNDNYGKNSATTLGLKQSEYSTTKAGEWKNIEFWYVNNAELNTDKLSIFENSSFGINPYNSAMLSNSYQIKNLKYNLIKQ